MGARKNFSSEGQEGASKKFKKQNKYFDFFFLVQIPPKCRGGANAPYFFSPPGTGMCAFEQEEVLVCFFFKVLKLNHFFHRRIVFFFVSFSGAANFCSLCLPPPFAYFIKNSSLRRCCVTSSSSYTRRVKFEIYFLDVCL